MTDQPQDPQPKKSLVDTVHEHFCNLNIQAKCPMCGGDAWSIEPMEIPTLKRGPDTKSIPITTSHGVFPLAAMTCTRCFTVQFLAFIPLARSLATVKVDLPPAGAEGCKEPTPSSPVKE